MLSVQFIYMIKMLQNLLTISFSKTYLTTHFFLFYVIALVYKFAPSVHTRWPLVTAGSILATSLTLITTLLFSYWVNHFASYNRVYGSIGTVLIIMLLINLNSLILLIGFELNVSVNKLLSQQKKPFV